MRNWIDDISIGHCDNGHFVRIEGSDIFEEINCYGSKGRKSLSIAEGLQSNEQAKQIALEWLNKQILKVSQ